MIHAVIEKIKVKHALAIPAGTPIVLGNEIIYIPLLDTFKTINILKRLKQVIKYSDIFT